MSLNRRDAFKAGFIKCCHDQGLVQEDQIVDRAKQVLAAVEKRAGLADLINRFAAMKPKQQAKLWPLVLGLGVGVPFAGGVGTGMLASKLKGNWLTEEDVKQQELTDELKRQTALAKQYSRLGGV